MAKVVVGAGITRGLHVLMNTRLRVWKARKEVEGVQNGIKVRRPRSPGHNSASQPTPEM